MDHLKYGLLDLRALLVGGGEDAHGRAGDEGADYAPFALQLQANHLKGNKCPVSPIENVVYSSVS